jgi:hypothetical protein
MATTANAFYHDPNGDFFISSSEGPGHTFQVKRMDFLSQVNIFSSNNGPDVGVLDIPTSSLDNPFVPGIPVSSEVLDSVLKILFHPPLTSLSPNTYTPLPPAVLDDIERIIPDDDRLEGCIQFALGLCVPRALALLHRIQSEKLGRTLTIRQGYRTDATLMEISVQ